MSNKLKDGDIRAILLSEFTQCEEFILDPATVIIHELDVCAGNARIDVAVVNGKIHGFEIKSESDTLERLPSQAEYYEKIFDTITLVATENHCSKAMEIIPDWWGIKCVSSKKGKLPSIETIRDAKQNENIDPFNLTQLLWKSELLELLNKNSVTRGIKSKSRTDLGKIVAKVVDIGQLSEFLRSKLKSRKDWRALQLQQLYDDLQQL